MTHRQHLATAAWLDEFQQRTPASRSDMHVSRLGWMQLDPDKRPTFDEFCKMYRQVEPEPEGPYPKFTKETAAAARAAVQRFHLTKQGAKFLGD